MSKFLTTAILISTLACVNVFAIEPSFEVGADFYGKYIWRGQNLNNKPVFQPSVSMCLDKLSMTVWSSMDLTNSNDNAGDFSEIDYAIDYSDSLSCFGGLNYSFGLVYYDFPSTDFRDTTEAYASFGLACILSPTISIFKDLDEADGSYVSFGVSHTLCDVMGKDSFNVDLCGNLGWASKSYNKYYWGVDHSKAQDLSFSMSIPLECNGWAIRPSLNYVTILSDQLRDTDAYSTDSDYLYGGISISKSF